MNGFEWLEMEPPDDVTYEISLLEKHKNVRGTNAAANGWTECEWRDYVRYELKHIRAGYTSRDDLFAPWRALAFCRSCGVPPPAWAHGYLDRVVTAMDTLSQCDGRPGRPAPPSFAAAVLKALEMTRSSSGPGTALFRRRIGADVLIIGWAVVNELVVGGCTKEKIACKRTAQRFGISIEKARLAYKGLGLTRQSLEAMRQAEASASDK